MCRTGTCATAAVVADPVVEEAEGIPPPVPLGLSLDALNPDMSTMVSWRRFVIDKRKS